MARPLRKPHVIKIRLTPDELLRVQTLSGGSPLGPWVVAAAIRAATAGSSNPKAALESWGHRWAVQLRGNPSARSALQLLLKAVSQEPAGFVGTSPGKRDTKTAT